MAKKVKTPEEVKASIDKKVAKRKIFFGTFSKALALFLAVAMVYSLATIAFTPAVAPVAGPSGQTNNTDGNKDDENLFGGDETPDDGEKPSTGDETPDDGQKPDDSKPAAKPSKEEMAKLLNEVTAKAAKAGYDWNRACDFKPNGDIKVTAPLVGDATNAVNSFIKTYDENSDLNSVVGGFLATGKRAGTHAKNANVIKDKDGNDQDAKFLLKATNITAADIQSNDKQGDVYMYQILTCVTPYKDGKNAMNRATNDFVAPNEVQQSLKDTTGGVATLDEAKSQVTYSKIVIKATIKDNALQKLELSYDLDVNMILKLGPLSVTGVGQAETSAVYSNFVY